MQSVFFSILFLSIAVGAAEPSLQTELPEVRVVRKRTAEPAIQSEVPSQFLPSNEEKGSSLGALLRQIPSVEVKPSLQDENPTFLIRGQDPHQSRIFLEGIPLTDAEFNQGDMSAVMPEMLAGADVFAEAIPTFLMADGLGGALNLRLAPNGERLPTAISARGGSFGYLRATGRVSERLIVPATLGIEIARSREDFLFFDDNGTPFNTSDDTSRFRENNGYWRATVMPVLEWKRSPALSIRSIHLAHLSSKDIPGPILLPTQGTLRTFTLLNGLSLQAPLSPEVTSDWLLYGRWNDEKLEAHGGSIGLVPGQAQSLAIGLKTVISGGKKEGVRWGTSFGLAYDRYNREEEAEVSMRPSRTHIPLGAQLTVPLGKVKLRPAVLGNLYAYSFSGTVPAWMRAAATATEARSYALLSPRLGVDYDLTPRLKLHLAGGRFHRAPSLFELYGSASGVLPSPDLNPEQAWKAEVGVDAEWPKISSVLRTVRVSASVHVARADNLITLAQNSQATQMAVNVGAAQIWGQELLLETEWWTSLRLTASATFLQTRNLSSISYENGKQLPGRSPYRYRLAAAYEPVPWSLGYEWNYYGPTYWDLANVKKMKGFSDHGAFVSYKTRGIGTFLLEGRNLLDSITAGSYFDSIAVTDNTTGYLGYPAPGRRIYLTWRLEL